MADLRRIKSTLKDALKDDFEFVPSNDEKGDCSLVLALKFDSEEKARAFKTKFGGGELPIDTGKHVYSNWTAIMKKRGAFNPLIDPFKMEANKDMVPDYTEDMCPKTLDILSRTVYIYLNPDRTDAEIQEIIEKCKNAKP